MSKADEAFAPPEVDAVQIDAPVDNDQRPPSCCLCMDVRIGAVLIGLFNLVCHAFWIISLASYFMREKHNIGEYESQWKMVGKFQEFAQQHKENVNHHMVAMVVATLSFLIVVMLIFGAALRRSSYILPFFCVQVFDICMTVLIAITSINYAPQLKHHLELSEDVHRQCIRNMSMGHFRMMMFTVWMIVLLLKYYMTSVIWDCYQHCKTLEQRRVPNHHTHVPLLLYQGDMETMNLLPTYDDVVKTSPPPAYAQ